MATVCRRASDPCVVQQLWDAIKFVRAQKQIANEERIVRHMQREHGDSMADTASVQLHHAVDDGLIITYRAHQQKLGSVGSEQTAYRIPDEDQVSRVKNLLCIAWHCGQDCIICVSKLRFMALIRPTDTR